MSGIWFRRVFLRPVLRLILALFVTAISGCSRAEAASGLTVGDLLRLEDIGTVAFGPQGQHLVFERRRPYERSPVFGRELLAGRDRSDLYAVDITQAGAGELHAVSALLAPSPGRGYWLGPFSPDGTKLVIFWIENNKVATGVFDLKSEKLNPLAITPALPNYGVSPLWISDRELVYITLAAGEQPSRASSVRTRPVQQYRFGQRAASGDQVTVQVVASGPGDYPDGYRKKGALVRVDVATGNVQQIGRGDFMAPILSSDGRYLALLRYNDLLHGPGALLPRSHPQLATRGAELVVYDLAATGHGAYVCTEHQPIAGSLFWSRDGRHLLFLDRSGGRSDMGEDKKTDLSLVTFDPGTGCVARSLPQGLRLAGDPEKNIHQTHALWLGGSMAVYATVQGHPGHADWYLLNREGQPLNLTSGFRQSPREVMAAGADYIMMAAEGAIWRIGKDGSRKQIAQIISTDASQIPGSRIRVWRPPSMVPDLAGPSTSDRIIITLQGADSAQQFKSVHLKTGEVTDIGILPAGQKVLAASAHASALVFREEASDGSHLRILSPDGIKSLIHFNQHLKGVQTGPSVRLRYHVGKGAERTAWLLLPEKRGVNGPYPLIVNVYPGATSGGPWPWHLSSISPFNPYLLTAKGYAVLFPGLPMGPEGVAAEPLSGLAQNVLAAVDHAIEQGYADPDRLGLFGHSYGGYGALGILSQTRRFKAAIVSAAPTNLLSIYGQFDPRFYPDANPAMYRSLMWWAEAGQGRMGGPPWTNTARYIRNSPLFAVEQISTPLMLVQGDRDFVPVSQGEEMFTALYRLNKQAIFLRYAGEGHVLASPANIRDFIRRMINWYDQYL